jgi:hypothetical protein
VMGFFQDRVLHELFAWGWLWTSISWVAGIIGVSYWCPSFLYFSFFLFWGRPSYLARAGLKLFIFLLQAPKCWDYRHVLPFLAFVYVFISTTMVCVYIVCVCACVHSGYSKIFLLIGHKIKKV